MAEAASSWEERRQSARVGPSKLADILYDAFYSAAVGGSVLSLFFLVVDLAQGRPLFTPSLLGSVLFTGASPESVVEIRLDMVSYFSIVHFAMFGWIGLALSVMVHLVKVHSRHPREVILGLFVVLEGSFLLAANLFMPGVVATIGFGRIVVGNLLTATAMTLVMVKSHNPEAWDRLIHGRPVV